MHKEEWGLLNYGNRGPRGRQGERGIQGVQGEPGKDGLNGKVQDVFVNSSEGYQTVVDSEGNAFIDLPSMPDVTIGKDLTVTIDLGGYSVGDTITKDTKLQDILENILAYVKPVPPVTDKAWYGVTNSVPTNIDASWTSEDVASGTSSFTHYFNANRQYEAMAYPATFGDLSAIYENDLPNNLLSEFTKLTVTYNDVAYKLYYGTNIVKETNAKYEFVI